VYHVALSLQHGQAAEFQVLDARLRCLNQLSRLGEMTRRSAFMPSLDA
jgi:hypothetical protein